MTTRTPTTEDERIAVEALARTSAVACTLTAIS